MKGGADTRRLRRFFSRRNVRAGLDEVIYSDAFAGSDVFKLVYAGTLDEWCSVRFTNIYANPLFTAGSTIAQSGFVTDLSDLTVDTIGDFAFAGWNDPTFVDNVFGSTTGSRSVSGITLTVGDGVVSLPRNLFVRNVYVRSVYIPESVKSIGTNAFDGCTGLKSATFEVTEGWEEFYEYSNTWRAIESLSDPADAAQALTSHKFEWRHA